MITAPDSFRIAHDTVIQLHQSRKPEDLAPAIFKFLEEVLVQEIIVLLPRPLDSNLRGYSSRPELQRLCDDYIAFGQSRDIWLKRSPKGPGFTVIRHSLYTPKDIFHRSRFYKEVMVGMGCEYGASLVAWRGNNWLGTVTIFRTVAQGDFRDDELPILKACQLHFRSVVNRIAADEEERLGRESLATLIWSLPTAGFVLDWNLKPLHWNAASQELVTEWKTGFPRMSIKRARGFSVPGEIQASIDRQRSSLDVFRGRPRKSRTSVRLSPLQHPRLPGLTADISFVPSRSLSLSKGAFVVVIHRRSQFANDRDSVALLAKLTRRERDVALLAAAGKKSREIAQKLGTSVATVRKQLQNVYGKLAIKSRYELVSLFSRHPLARVAPASREVSSDGGA